VNASGCPKTGPGATLERCRPCGVCRPCAMPTNDAVAKNQRYGTPTIQSRKALAAAREFSTRFAIDTRMRRGGRRKQASLERMAVTAPRGRTKPQWRGREREREAAACAATLQRYVKDPFGNEQH
jgi:hypothetical protein